MKKVWRDVRRSFSRSKVNEHEIEVEWIDGETTHILIVDMKKGKLYNQLMAGVTELRPDFQDYLKWEATAPQQQYWYITDEGSLLFAIKWESGRRVYMKTIPKKFCSFDFQADSFSSVHQFQFALDCLRKRQNNSSSSSALSPIGIQIIVGLLRDAKYTSQRRKSEGTVYSSLIISDVTQQISEILQYARLERSLRIATGFFFPENREISKEYSKEMLDKYDARVENVGSDKKAVTSVTDINLWLNDMQIESVKNFAEICLQRTHDAVLLNITEIHSSLPRCISKKVEFQSRRHSLSLTMFNFCKVLPYYENEYVQMIGIPLNGDPSCHLFIMLPKEANRLEHCENFMTGKKLLKLLGSMWYHKVEVSIPKFNISDQHDLNEKLEHLQVPEMMGDEKYLQKISNEPFISLLTLHCVRLSFRGSEMEDQQEDEVEVVDDAPPLSFVADRPFLYLITKNLTLVLIGRLEP